MTRQAKLIFKLDFLGNLWLAAFAILSMFYINLSNTSVVQSLRSRRKKIYSILKLLTNHNGFPVQSWQIAPDFNHKFCLPLLTSIWDAAHTIWGPLTSFQGSWSRNLSKDGFLEMISLVFILNLFFSRGHKSFKFEFMCSQIPPL